MTTDTDAPEELEVPDFKDRLWHELVALHAEHRRSQTAASAGGSVLMRWRSRRPFIMVAAAAAVVVAGVVTAQLVGASSDTPLMARIAAATDEAIASSVIHWVDEQTLPGEAGPSLVNERWTDEASGATRFVERDGQGDPLFDVGPLTPPTVESPDHSGQRVVDYCTQQYLEHRDIGGPSIDIDSRGIRQLRDAVAAGRWVEDGTEVVDGQELIRLIRADGESGAGDVLLVDPETYLPVRMRGTLSLGETFSQTYEYLARTPENLALLRPPVPDGFTKVDPLGRRPNSCGS
jgi:hypothetical protein